MSVGRGGAGPIAARGLGPFGGGAGAESEEFADDGGRELATEFEQRVVRSGRFWTG